MILTYDLSTVQILFVKQHFHTLFSSDKAQCIHFVKLLPRGLYFTAVVFSFFLLSFFSSTPYL